MTTLVLQAQDKKLTSEIKDSDKEEVAMALNLEITSEINNEEAGALPFIESTSAKIIVETLQKKENLDFVLTASAIPEAESVLLSIDQFDGLSYKLYDLDGNILEARQIVSFETPVELIYLIPSDYFIEVSSDEELLKKFKIIKK